MRHLRILLVALAVALLAFAGCINVEKSDSKDKPATTGTETNRKTNGETKSATGGGWSDRLIDIVGGQTLASKSGALVFAYDTLAYPGKDVDLVFEAKKVKGFSGIAGLTVDFKLAGKSLGTAETDGKGRATLKWKPPKAGSYEIAAGIAAAKDETYAALTELKPAPLCVSARTKDTKFVVIDLDHTVVASSFIRVIVGGAKPVPDAAKVVKELESKYSIVYLTHRPDLLTVNSKNWLKDHKFPRAPLLVSSLKEAFGDSGKFKTGRLKDLRKAFPAVALGIGDRLSDSQAYVDNGLKAYLIPHYDHDDDEDCRDMARDLRELNKDVQVVDTWKEIREGVFNGKQFPLRAYADRLDARAKTLKRKDKDDDDDD